MTLNEPGGAGVIITTKDIYDKLVDVEKVVSQMTPQAQVLLDHEGRIRGTEAAIPKDLEKRLLSVEKWKWAIPPAFITAAIAIVEQLLSLKK